MRSRLLPGALAALLTSTALADVSFYSIGSRLATREFDDEAEQILDYSRLFTGDMTLLAGQVFADEPGYRNVPGTFSGPGTLTVSVRAALRRWNGSGFETTTDRLNIQQFSGLTSIYTPVSDPANPDTDPLEHFDWSVDAGELHQHPDYYLVDSSLSAPGSAGIYLAQFHAETNVDGLSRSYPFFKLLNYDQSAEDLDAAVAYTLENVVPAPGMLALAGPIAFAASRRRR